MEEKRIKKGLELLPSLHRRMKSIAAERGIPMWQAVEGAFSAWINQAPVATQSPEVHYATPNRELHEKLETILNSGDEMTIAAVVPNIEIFYARLKPISARRKSGS